MATARQDVRFRRFRAVSLAVYLVFTIGFSSLVTVSVFRSVFAMSPKPPAVAQALSMQECAAKARSLFDELDGHRRNLSQQPEVVSSDLRWSRFRLDWLTRTRQVEAQCSLHEASREKLKIAFRELDHLLDLFTVHAVQFAGEIGPSLDATRRALDAAGS